MGRVNEVTSKAKKVCGHFNNHFHAFAIESSLKMLGASTKEQDQLLACVTESINAAPGLHSVRGLETDQ